MKTTLNEYAGQPEILKRRTHGELFQPITVAAAAFTNGVCKAGNPMKADGTKANTADAAGILLYDVYEENPNGSIVTAFATINTTNAQKNSGVAISAEAKGALKNLVFEA